MTIFRLIYSDTQSRIIDSTDLLSVLENRETNSTADLVPKEYDVSHLNLEALRVTKENTVIWSRLLKVTNSHTFVTYINDFYEGGLILEKKAKYMGSSIVPVKMDKFDEMVDIKACDLGMFSIIILGYHTPSTDFQYISHKDSYVLDRDLGYILGKVILKCRFLAEDTLYLSDFPAQYSKISTILNKIGARDNSEEPIITNPDFMAFLRTCFHVEKSEYLYLKEPNWIYKSNSEFIRGFLQGFCEMTMYNFTFHCDCNGDGLNANYEKVIEKLLRMNNIYTDTDISTCGNIYIKGKRSQELFMELMEDTELELKIENNWVSEYDYTYDIKGDTVALLPKSITHSRTYLNQPKYINDFSISFDGENYIAPLVLV